MSLPPNLLTVTDYFMVKGQAPGSERELDWPTWSSPAPTIFAP